DNGSVSSQAGRRQTRPVVEHPDGTTSTTPTRDGRPLLNFKSPRVSQPQQHLADMSMDERVAAVKEMGLPAFRAKQISTHYFSHYVTDTEAMTDLPKDLRGEIQQRFFPHLLTEVRRLRTENGDTIKFLWRLFDGALVESVLMRYRNRVTLCVSSQRGCGMNCPFCATGQQGLTRNMSTAEIVEQVVRANQVIAAGELAEAPASDMPGAGETALGAEADGPGDGEAANDEEGTATSASGPERVSKLVFMGMGEPLAHLKRVMNAHRRIAGRDPEGPGDGEAANGEEGTATSASGPERVSNIVFMGMGEPLANYKRVMNAVRRFVGPAPEGLGMSPRRITISTVGLVPGINKLAAEDIPVTFALSLHAPDDELRD